MRILGIHCDSPHDSGVAVLEDGRLTFAVNEERLSRVKNDGGAPDKSLAEMTRSTGLALSDFDAIWHTGWTPARLLRNSGAYSRASYAMRRAGKWYGKEWMAVFKSPRNALGLKDYRINMRKHEKLMALLADYRGPIRHVSHHSCHAYAAYYAGGIPGSLTLVVEGVGDNKTTSWFLPGAKGLEEKQAQEWPHSVGRFYECVTKILGFNIVRHGGKITGLAAYGDPESKTYDKVRPMLRREGDRMLVSPLVYQLIRAWSKEGRKTPAYFEGASREDISAAFQRRLEEVVVEWVEHLVKATGVGKISAGGGVFANVKMNQRIHEIPGVEEIMVHPGMSDVGLAVGAAYGGWEAHCLERGERPEPQPLPHAYLGPEYAEKEMEAAIRAAGLPFERCENVEEKVAEAIHAGKVVGRFNGRMEYGPRALGNRSMLYHARDREVNDWLNKKLKRTEFMPFAPACLYEAKDRLFKNVAGAERSAEFMTVTFDATPEMAERGAAAVHVDNTARPQLVRADTNPSFYKIIAEYEKRSGFPCLINTSFNMHEEPIVCTPEDGVKGFVDSEVDCLAMGPFLARLR